MTVACCWCDETHEAITLDEAEAWADQHPCPARPEGRRISKPRRRVAHPPAPM